MLLKSRIFDLIFEMHKDGTRFSCIVIKYIIKYNKNDTAIYFNGFV